MSSPARGCTTDVPAATTAVGVSTSTGAPAASAKLTTAAVPSAVSATAGTANVIWVSAAATMVAGTPPTLTAATSSSCSPDTVTCVPPVNGAAATERSLVTVGPWCGSTSTSGAAIVSVTAAAFVSDAATTAEVPVRSSPADAATAPNALTPMIAVAQPRATVRRNAPPVARRLRTWSAR